MKGKKILSISIATACLLMNTPLSVFAVGNTGANEVRFTDTSSAADIQVAVSVPQTAAIPAVKAAAVTPTTAEPYTLTAEDVDVTRCREDDNDSNTPYMDAVQISWRGVTDLSQPQYKNIVIPDTLPFDKPVLDDEGKEQKDEDGNVITETVEMPVIKAYLGYGEFSRSNLEKVTVSKNVKVLGDFKDCENLSEVVIPEDSALEAFSADAFSKTGIQTLFIPAGITELPERMFFASKNLTTVTFAEGSKLEKIGAYAFRESGLTAIDIPDAVTEFGEYAFNQCALEEISLPDAMSEIPQYTFAYCTTLKKVSFGSGLTSIGDGAFTHTALEELVIPDSITHIGWDAFNDIEALKSVTFGNGLKEIGGCVDLGDYTRGIFQNDVNVETVVFSEGLEKIGDELFKWSAKIETLVIPSTVKHIGRAAFGGFNGISGSEVHALSSLTFAENSQLENIFPYAFCFNSIKHLTLPVAAEPFKIWDDAFEASGELLDVDLGNCRELGSDTGYTSEEYYETNAAVFGAFKGCGELKTVTFSDELEIIHHGTFASCTSLLGPIVFPANLKKIGNEAFNGCSMIEDVTFNEGLETIGNLAFCGCELHEINLPDTVKEVGDRCFEGNLHVEKVKFSANMTVIPDRFLDCYAQDVAAYSVGKGSHTNVGQHGMLKELIIPDNIKEIGIDAFDCALDLETLDLGKVEYIGTGAFSVHGMLLDELGMEHGSLKTVVMSPCLKEIGTVPPHSVDFEGSAYAGVFDGQGDFDGLVLPATLEKVGAYTFNGCAAIKEFTMTENLKSVGSHAFDGCTNLTALTFADSASTKFEDEVFKNCKALTEIALPAWLDTVPVGMFSGCRELTEVTLSEGVSHLGGMAFADTGLTSLTLPESCLYVDDAAFQNAPVSSVTFGSKTVSIGANAFVRDTNVDLMASVIIPESVKSIGKKAFGYYKDTDKNYEELCAEAERLEAESGEPVDVQSLIPPTIANNNFILYGGTAAKKYAEQNNMIYGGAIGDTQDVVYPVTEGSEQNISADATEATFRINCDYEKFSGVVKVDGKELKRGTDYTDKSGSTVITLTESYLKTLAPGKHTMEAVFEDGYAKAGFTIEEATETTTEPVTDKPTEPIVTEPQPTTPKPTSSVVKPSSKLKNNPVKVTVKAKIVKLKKLKKKAQTIKAITIKSAKGKVSCKITKAAKIKKYLKINAKGVITFKAWKKAKKGTYKIKVKITVKGNSKYKPKTIKKTVKITLN